MNAENDILCGLWVGPTKPIMNLLLDPIHVREINLQLLQQRPPLPISFNPEAFKILEGFATGLSFIPYLYF